METSYIEHRQIKAHISTFFPPRRTKFLQFWIKKYENEYEKNPFLCPISFFSQIFKNSPPPARGILKNKYTPEFGKQNSDFRDRVLGSG